MRGVLAGGVKIGFFFTGTNFFIHWAVAPSFLLQDAKKNKTKKLSAPSRFRRKGEKKGRRGPTGWEIPFKGHHFKISTSKSAKI